MTSKSSIPPPIKQARKALAAKIRNDFEYTFPSYVEGTASIHQTLNIATATTGNDASLATVTGWRERTDSDPSTTEEDGDQPEVVPVRRNRTRMDAEDGQQQRQMKVGGEEAEGEIRRQSRKRRRRERAEQEMEWNTGLVFWEARRDAWCAARKVPAGYNYNYNYNYNPTQYNSSPASSASARQPSTSSSYHYPQQQENQTRLIKILPVPLPLLPTTDPTRASITPAMYPSIYAKVVNQGLVPAVPINLSDVIPALVQGWQNDGEWPPKPSVPEPTMTTKIKSSLRDYGQGQAQGGAYSRHPPNYGAPAREGDAVVKKRGVSGLFGAVTGIMAGNSSSSTVNGKKEKEKEKEQQPPSPRNSGVGGVAGGTGGGSGGDQGMRRIISRHLRSKSSILSLSSARSDTQTTERSMTERSGNISDNDTPGGNGLFEENLEKRAQSPSTSPMSKRKSPSRVTRVLRSWASGSMPAHREAAGG